MEHLSEQISIAILAGGRSLRMGRDKARLVIDGVTLLERTARIGIAADLNVRIIGRNRPPDWTVEGATFGTDLTPDNGPLGGLLTALRDAKGTAVLLLACDMPRLTTEAVRWIVNVSLDASGPDGLIAEHNGRFEPLFSVYTPHSIPLVEARLASRHLSMSGMVETGHFGKVAVPDWVGDQLHNLNTPQDLIALI
jgi:molybdopterin-guanine dinucleotide biosynthesis protein A